MNVVVQAALRTSTHKLYERAWKLLCDFGQKFGLQIFPLDSVTLGLFMTNLHHQNYATSTIRTFVSAISYYHKILGHQDPGNSFLISKTFQGLKQLKPSQDIRQPITLPLLHQIVDSLEYIPLDPYNKLLYKTMFLVSFYGLCRVSEVTSTPSNHTLLAEDVLVISVPAKIIITFRTFKHSITKQSVTIRPHHPTQYCPVMTIKNYLAQRPSSKELFVFKSGKTVPRMAFVKILKQCILLSNKDPELYKTHSFRIGGATLAAQVGLTHLQIQRLGRWRSNAFLKYLRW